MSNYNIYNSDNPLSDFGLLSHSNGVRCSAAPSRAQWAISF